MKLNQIFENNKRWILEKLKIDADYFSKLSEGQNPEILYIGCSDSRVTAEELMGINPGEAFVHRNIANMVPNTDLNSMSVINYAVYHLKVNHVVVCGQWILQQPWDCALLLLPCQPLGNRTGPRFSTTGQDCLRAAA